MKDLGILLHISSLPGTEGIGTLGQAAYRFVDLLSQSGVKYWQVLPVNMTHDSPYSCVSAFAGNPELIDLQSLKEEGYLRRVPRIVNTGRVDYKTLSDRRADALHEAYRAFVEKSEFGGYDAWREGNPWAAEAARYLTVKQAFVGKPFYEWEDWAVWREGDRYQSMLDVTADEQNFYLWEFYQFDVQWQRLRAYAHERGVEIIGDMPIYVGYDSADVWSEKSCFLLDGVRPRAVAGVPPDYFSETGQVWGSPLYDWSNPDTEAWWTLRLRRALRLYDRVRIDHFRAFAQYFSIPYGDTDARRGHWEDGPGKEFFERMESKLGALPLIAEDLGTIDDRVRRLLQDTGYPGMKVLQFAFDGNPDNEYLPENHIPNCVVYTGTHDNATTKGWTASLDDNAQAVVRRMLGLSRDGDLCRAVIDAALKSCADTVILPLQDVLGLGEEARMNTPSTVDAANWSWRMRSLPSAARIQKGIKTKIE